MATPNQSPKSLKPGEYIARARLHDSSPDVVRFEDVVVTAETLPQLRASGRYAAIITPRALLAGCVHAGEPRCTEATRSIDPRANSGKCLQCVKCGAMQ